MKICLLDPSLQNQSGSPSDNLGDLIIHRAVNRELKHLFGDCEIVRISTHDFMDVNHIKLIQSCSLVFIGGTNLLSSNMKEYRQWKISLKQAIRIKKAILLGVGWWQYQSEPNLYTKTLLNLALSQRFVHSVRDSHTHKQLSSLYIKRSLNTGCPTMWPLADGRFEDIPKTKSSKALLMITDYLKQPEADRKLIELLLSKYEQVFFWPQGKGDAEYVSNMELPVTWLERSLESLDKFVDSEDFDYVGTRLHGGVRCLLSKKRSLILEVDNRAREIALDTGLPTAKRDDFAYIAQWIEQPPSINIKMDSSRINQWRSQFKGLVPNAAKA
jgi:hypothetical protein